MIIPKYFEDIHTFDVGTEPLRSYYIPLSPSQDAKVADRAESERFRLLNGDWKFRYFDSVYDCQDAFYEEGYAAEGYGTIPVPSNWQDHGCGLHQYTNTRYPFPFDPPYVPHDNPCGAYLLDFAYRRPDGTDSYYLNFEGADSCLYVWLNGAFIGYHQVSHAPCEFNVTEHLREGQNRLAVLVLKWCDGSYLEDQDKFRTSGIFRDVYLLARPKDHIRDYFVKTVLKDGYQAADISVDLSFSGDPVPVSYTLTDADGREAAAGNACGGKIAFSLSGIRLWSAEDPYLYTLKLSSGNEVIYERVGLREIRVIGSVVYLNGSRIRFRGVNRHDSDPCVGSAVTLEHIRRDMTLMKQHNFNAIRTSHYPNMPQFYQLCDEYGFYVIDESDLEAHGVVDLFDLDREKTDGVRSMGEFPFPPFLCDNPDWTDAVVDRVKKNVTRDKNRPCVLIWSMGNESGYGCCFEAALAWTKSYDPGRLTHYESSMHRPWKPSGGKNDYSNIDLRSRMYASIPEMHAYLGSHPDKPFIQCEFIHAMGNGPGDIEDYYQLEEQYDSYAGGFVWEWCDHGVYMGTTADGKKKYYYGGDSGEFPHDGNFCMDGLVYPDRTPSPGVKEYKNVHRPMRVHLVDAEKGIYELQNNLDFTNLKDFLYISYEILKDGKMISSGEIRDTQILDVPPRAKKEVHLPITPAGSCCSVLIRARKLDADRFREAGFELGFDQLTLTDGKTAELTGLLASETANASGDESCGRPVSWEEDDRFLYIRGRDFLYTFHKLTGMFEKMVYQNYSFLEKPMEMNIWRAPTDNDRVVKRLWYEAGYDRPVPRTYEVRIENADAGAVKITAVSSLSAVYRQRYLDIRTEWLVMADGRVKADFDVERDNVMNGPLGEYFRHGEDILDTNGIVNEFAVTEAYLPRLGLRMFLPKEMNRAAYYGYGPYESYIDKHRASYVGRFTSDVAQMHEDYLRPQENGSHYGCEYVSVSGPHSRLTAYNEDDFSFNVSEYTAEELTKKAHNYELEKSGHTVLCLDYRQSGIGSGSCGPQLARKYRLNGRHYQYSFRLKPEVF